MHKSPVKQRYYEKHKKEIYERRRENPEYREYAKKYAGKHYAMRKERMDALKAGGCVLCGYNVHPNCLDWHHREPEQKTWTINQFMNRNYEVVLEEIKSCVLLCANCHRIMHVRLKAG